MYSYSLKTGKEHRENNSCYEYGYSFVAVIILVINTFLERQEKTKAASRVRKNYGFRICLDNKCKSQSSVCMVNYIRTDFVS